MRMLVGDVGGTKSRLGLYAREAGRLEPIRVGRYPSAEFGGLADIAEAFLAEGAEELPDAACFGVPCPLRDGVCRPPNLDWEIDERALEARLGMQTVLINDLEAVGHSIRLLGPADLEEIQPGAPDAEGPIAIVGAGTGLGHAYLTPGSAGPVVHASEGGHADFAARTARDLALVERLSRGGDRVPAERVISGPGLHEIYRFLRDSGEAPESDDARREMGRGDPSRVIGERGSRDADPLSRAALDWLVAAYGAHCGNVALTLLATGGVYLSGGIAPDIAGRLRDGPFREAFRAKGDMEGILSRIPIRVITNPDAPLLGAAEALSTAR